ncbi:MULTISPECIES: hypothetical protein [Cyanophyceae]|uniref:hypothetical protein n=1 Tax=Cyanophyceae TaxID=3028117 RepID=UPI0016833D76|nr:hypothetical protein [Trichocoleus sp. FACHB-40]MBD2005633.1 hypothetical protein [Trichocoleus sp. FACHB-40]
MINPPDGFTLIKRFCTDEKLLSDLATYARSLPWHEAPCHRCVLHEGRKRCGAAKNGDIWRLDLVAEKETVNIKNRGQEWRELVAKLPKFPHPEEDFQPSFFQVAKYDPRAILEAHKDDPLNFSRMAFLDVCGDAFFSLKKSDDDLAQKFEVKLEPGDLVFLSGEAFLDWYHEARNLDTERIILLMADSRGSHVEEGWRIVSDARKIQAELRELLNSL